MKKIKVLVYLHCYNFYFFIFILQQNEELKYFGVDF